MSFLRSRASSSTVSAGRVGLALGVWALVGLLGPLVAAEPPPASSIAASTSVPAGTRAHTLSVFVADQLPVVAVTLYNARGLKDQVTLEVALDDPRGLVLDPDQFTWLHGATPTSDASTAPVEFSFADGERLQLPAADVVAENDPERVNLHNLTTVYYAADLHELKLKGKIGLGLLRRFQIDFDLNARRLVLTPPVEVGAETDAGTAPLGGFVARFDFTDRLLAIPLAGSASPAHLVIGSAALESRLDPAFAASLGHPLGDVSSLVLGTTPALDLASQFAFRAKSWRQPRSLTATHPVALSGIELLQAYRLTIDWTTSTLALTPTRAATPAADHRRYFAAETPATPESLQSFLQEFPQSYFAREAARRLIEMRLAQRPLDAAATLAALRWHAESALPERRTEVCVPVVKFLSAQPDQTDLNIAAAELALSYSRAAAHIQDVYVLHRYLGIAFEQKGNWDAAWKHLLSASFVKLNGDDPHTLLCAIHLGRVYEKQARYGRAYSRFKAALPLAKDHPSLLQEAQAALVRLREKIPADQLQELDQL